MRRKIFHPALSSARQDAAIPLPCSRPPGNVAAVAGSGLQRGGAAAGVAPGLPRLAIRLLALAITAVLPPGIHAAEKDWQGIDTHTHLYEPEHTGWNQPGHRLNRPVHASDFLETAKNTPLRHTVVVEASQLPEANQWMLDHAENNDAVVAVIANVRIDATDFAEQIDALAAHSAFRGIRDRAQPPVDYSNPAIPGNLAYLEEKGFVFETGIGPRNEKAMIPILKKLPALTCIVNHLAAPSLDAGGIPRDGWKDTIRALGSLPNAYCKISSLDFAQGQTFPPMNPEILQPVLRHVVECFSPDRVLYGSNWPVSPKEGGFESLMAPLLLYVNNNPSPTLRQVLVDNPVKAYKLTGFNEE